MFSVLEVVVLWVFSDPRVNGAGVVGDKVEDDSETLRLKSRDEFLKLES